MKNKNLPFLIFWFLVCVGVVWFYTRHAFLRPTDDPKEAILYSSLFLFNLFLMPKWFYARKVMGSLPFFLVFVYLGYGFLNVLFVATAHFEGMALWGKEALLLLTALNLALLGKEKIVFACFILCVVGLAAFIFSVIPSQWVEVLNSFKKIPIGHISYYSDFALLSLGFCILFFYYFRFVTPKIFFGTASFFLFCLLWLSATRASLLGLGFALILAFCFLPQKKHILLWLSMAVVSLLFVNNGLHYSFRNVSIAQRFEKIIPEVEKHFSTNVVSNSVSNSLEPSLQIQQAQKNSRLCMYQNTWEGFLAKPLLGWGVGSFRYNYLRFIKPTDPEQSLLMKGHKVWVMYPHNESLKQLFESGFVGTLLFYMVYLLPCFAAFSLWKKKEDDLFLILLGVFYPSIGFVFQFDTAFHNPVMRLGLLIPLALGFYYLLDLKFSSWQIFFLKPLFVIFLFFSLPTLGYAFSSYYLAHGNKESFEKIVKLATGRFETLSRLSGYYIKKERFDLAEPILKRAVHTFPSIPALRTQLAHVFLKKGEKVKALMELKELQKMYPENEETRRLFDQVMTMQ